MGALSNIVAFDYENYIQKVVAALNNGENDPLILSEISIQNANRTFEKIANFENLQRAIKLFNSDLAVCEYGKLFAVTKDSIIETQRKFDKPKEAIWTYEDLAELFEPMLLRNCAKYFLSVGKIYSFEILIKSEDKRTQDLINKWDKGSEVWCHGDGGFAEGISGWLNNSEVKELNGKLELIELVTDRYNSNGNVLDALKELVRIAAKENLGLLYGNDLNMNLIPHFQYSLILSLKRRENENWEGHPTFENQIIKDYR